MVDYESSNEYTMFRATILFAALLLTVATKDASHKSSSEVGTTMHAGPYSPIAAMIEDKTKRSSFYQVRVRLPLSE